MIPTNAISLKVTKYLNGKWVYTRGMQKQNAFIIIKYFIKYIRALNY